MAPRRILHITESFHAEGGTETYLASLIDAQKNAGWDAAVGHFGAAPWNSPEEALASIRTFSPELIVIHRIIDPEFLSLVEKNWPTVHFVHDHSHYHCPGSGKFIPGSEAICQRKFSLFCAIAPYWQRCGSRRPLTHFNAYERVRKFRRSQSTRTFATASQYMKGLLVSEGVPGNNIHVIPLFPRKETAAENSQSPETPNILFVGRLLPQKGAHALLEVFSSIPSATLTLVGDGPDRDKLLALSKNLAGRVELTGWLSAKDLASRYRRASVVAVPSLWPEPFGLVGIEAMACARPVVAFDVGGISDWLLDGKTGYLVPPNRKDILEMKLRTLLDDKNLAVRLGEHGKEVVAARFSVEKHLKAYEQLFESLAK